jgi:2-polyprenyl-6-methoxyphenol hydroxylase-like FAD-dependent oxidoreductase
MPAPQVLALPSTVTTLSSEPRERVVVIGSGIGGLATALALKNSGREVVLVERDPEPPEITADRAFAEWKRPGVPQFRHAHILLSRLQTELRDHHPELLDELERAGIALSSLDEVLPEPHNVSYEPQAGDEDLQHLWGRRATFEYIARRHVERLPHVTILHSVRVEGFVTEEAGGALKVTGLQLSRGGKREVLKADVVVDASGKQTKSPEWLRKLGVAVGVDATPSDYTYVCRHYRLNDPTQSPLRRGTGGNLDYLWYGIFYEEHGHFSVAFACPTAEEEIAGIIRSEDGFAAVCKRIEVLNHWTSLAEGTTGVLGAGRFENRWFRYGARGGRPLLGFFAVGDALAQTNPMYGRGCSAAFVEAHVLAEALVEQSGALERARHYDRRTRALLKTHFDFCLVSDRMFLARAKRERGFSLPLRDRIVDHLYERAWIPAMRDSLFVARELVKAMQMRDVSSVPVRLVMVFFILLAWLRNAFKRENPAPLALGPARKELLDGLSPSTNPGLSGEIEPCKFSRVA